MVDRRLGRLLDQVEARADMQATGPCSRRTSACSIGSQWPDRKLGKPWAWGASRKLIDRQPFLPMRWTSFDGQVDVPHRHDAEGDEAPGVGAAPLVDGPVVVRLEHDQRELLVTRLGEGAGVEAGHRRKAHRRQHAVDVHVPDPLVDVEAAGTQLGVRPRVEAPLAPGAIRRWPPCRTASTSARPGTPTRPRPASLRTTLGASSAPLGRNVVLVHVRWLDHVVVDADQDHVFHAHSRTLPGRVRDDKKAAHKARLKAAVPATRHVIAVKVSLDWNAQMLSRGYVVAPRPV